MLEKTQGIVLRTLKYNDESVIVDIYTANNGAQGFIVRLPRSRKSPVRSVLLRPLSILNLEYDYRPQRALQFLKNMQVAEPYHSLPYEPMKETVALFLSEFLYHALRSEQRNEPLFDYIVNSLQWFDGQPGSFASFHLVFLMRLSRFLGFYPNLDDYASGDYFDLRESMFCAVPPVHRDFLDPVEAEKVQLMMRMDYPTMHLFRMSHQERNRLLEVTLTYYRLHIPDFPELKSVAVLQDLYR